MNASLMAQAAYSNETGAIRTPRSTEYDVFARITSALRKAKSPVQIADAIMKNRDLWTILAAEVADPANPLPKSLRARIFYLSEYVVHESRRVLRGESNTEALVDVNTAVMSGLRQRAPTA